MQKPSQLEDNLNLLEGSGGRGAVRSIGSSIRPAVIYTFSGAPEGSYGGDYLNSLSANSLVYHSKSSFLSASIFGSEWTLNSPTTLPSGVPIPHHLGRFDFGLNYLSRMEDKRSAGGGVSLGSASDRPLNSFREDTVSVNLFYSWPSGEGGSWIASLFYSNNNPISNVFPIPGIAYLYRSEDFVALFGIPIVSFSWKFLPHWTYSLIVFGLTGSMEVGYGHWRTVQAYVGFKAQQLSYLRSERADYLDRLIEKDERIYFGLRFPLADSFAMEIQGGYAFDRFLLETHRISFQPDLSDAVSLDSSFFIASGIRWQFF